MGDFVSALANYKGNVICYNLDAMCSFVTSIIQDYKELPYVKWYFAVKANSDEHVLHKMSSIVEGADCASFEEIELAKKSRFKEISVTCPGFNGDEVRKIVSQGIHFDIDNMGQLIDADLYNSSIGLRVNPQLCESRFGFESEQLPTYEYLKAHDLIIETLHFHFGYKDENRLEKMIEFVKSLIDDTEIFANLKRINIGGGLEDFYVNGKSEVLKQYLIRLHEFTLSKFGYSIEIIMEPGSLFALPIGYLKTRVKYLNNNKVFLGVSNFNLGEWNSLNILSINGNLITRSEGGNEYKIYGNTCYDGDCFGVFRLPIKLKKNDDIILYPTGAYTCNLVRNLHAMQSPRIIYYEQGEIHYE